MRHASCVIKDTTNCCLQAAQDRSWQMNTHDISQTMRGLANLRLGSRLLVQALVHRASTILDTFNTQVSHALRLPNPVHALNA